MAQLDAASILMIALVIVMGVAGVAVSVGRITRGGIQALGGLFSLVMLGGMLVFVVVIWFTFQSVSSSIGTGGSNPTTPYNPPIQFSTPPSFSTPTNTGPSIFGGP